LKGNQMPQIPDSILGVSDQTGLVQIATFCEGFCRPGGRPDGRSGVLTSVALAGTSVVGSGALQNATAGIVERGLPQMVSDVQGFTLDERRPIFDAVNAFAGLVLGAQRIFTGL
jgi:hypothetical protein